MVLAAPFHAYGISHWVAIALILLSALGLVAATRGRRWDDARTRRLRRIVAFGLIGLAVLSLLRVLLVDGIPEPTAELLPLHLCDVASFVAAAALLTGQRVLLATTVYWGLTLTMQALLTPDLPVDAPDPHFLLFFASHGLIVATALWLLFGLIGRLARGAWWRAFLVSEVWFVLAVLVNWIGGSNFGYLATPPAKPTLIDHLGPWPWYLLSMQIGVLVVWFVLSFALEDKRRPWPGPESRSEPES